MSRRHPDIRWRVAVTLKKALRSGAVMPELAIGTVLVVDDNAENRALAKATLEDADIEVALARSADEALAAFAQVHPSCILLDIRMPGTDGITCCERLRALPDGDRVAILFVTAQRDVESFDRAQRAGGDDFITKPFRPSELLGRIQTAMRLRSLTTERRDAIAELKRQRDELHRLQLHKEQLSSFLVHDLKNPVHSIELQAQRVLRNAQADERSRDAAQKIRDETRGLMRMLTNLLDIGKADEGALAPARRAIDPRSLAAEVVEELRMRAAQAEVELVAEVDVEQLYGDPDLLHRVLTNLVENAIRHAPPQSRVAIAARRVDHAVEVRVRDAGPGVPVEMRERVFDRFVSGGTCATGTNRGLGLAFCKVAIEAHGGQIWVEDGAPGAVFSFRVADAAVG